MFISKTDKFIDQLLDNIYNNIVKNDHLIVELDKIKSLNNFYQKHKILDQLISENISKIKEYKNLGEKYTLFYLLLLIGIYQKDIDTFVTNLINLQKNVFTNLINSEIIMLLTNNLELIKSIIQTIRNNSHNNLHNDNVLEFLNNLGKDYVEEYLKGDSLQNIHNLIKIIIIKFIYFKIDRVDIIKTLDQDKREYKYIEIVIPKTKYIDFFVIENMFTNRQLELGYATDFYELIQTSDDFIKKTIQYDDIIRELFHKKIIIPITEDFLRYHKDSERYDKYVSETDKDDTLIKYVVNKINKITNYYSKNNKDIEKLFYSPMTDKRATIINDIEEVKIIDKIIKSGISLGKSDLLIDLINYRTYPFINFKDFENNGFSIKVNNTIDIIRNVTFQHTQNNTLQLRVGSKDMELNISGIALNKIGKTGNLRCLTSNDFKKIEGNGYLNFTNILKNNIIHNKINPTYWIFNIKKDEFQTDTFNDIDTLSQEDYIKYMLTKLYSDIKSYSFIKFLNILNKHKSLLLDVSIALFDNFQKKYINLNRFDSEYKNLSKIIYYDKTPKTTEEYDEHENIIPGLIKEIIKLPTITEKKKDIQKVFIGEKIEIQEIYEESAICQHYVIWEQISKINSDNVNVFTQKFFEFYKRYITTNDDNEYICKSCGNLLDIKKYLSDDTSKGSLVFYMMTSKPLSEMSEYERYNKSIKNIDKLIERVAHISGLLRYYGNDPSIKYRRQGMTKDIIDLILIHQQTLGSRDRIERKERLQKMISNYNISEEFASFFLFKLSNDIFVFSSKEVDKFKKLKYNNILIYIIFLIIIDLDISQISYLTYDKLCNYFFFDKYGYKMFDNLLIKINDSDDLVPIKNYKLLCYVLYYFSCLLVKYKIWIYFDENQELKFSPYDQKTIIHTFVQLINSILEVNMRPDKHYLYEIVSSRFFSRLDTVYNEQSLIDKLDSTKGNRIKIDKKTNKYLFVKSDKPDFIINGTIQFIDLDNIESTYCFRYPKKYFITSLTYQNKIIPYLSQLTNCPDGNFHYWIAQNNDVICKICNTKLNNIYSDKISTKETSFITDIYSNFRLEKIAKFLCSDDDTSDIIIKCKDEYNINDLKKIMDVLMKNSDEKINNFINYINKLKKHHNKQLSKGNNFLKLLEQNYITKNSDINNIINKFINELENIIGTNININNSNTYVKYDTFIINHDHFGNLLDKPLIIINKNNEIKYRIADSDFKTDIIYYENRIKNVTVFYDAISKNLIGYRIRNKDITKIKSDKFIIVNLSIKNKLKLLGFKSRYINIDYISNENIYDILIAKITRDRISELKLILNDFQKIITQIAFKYESDNIIVKEYSKKIKKMNISSNDISVFKNNNYINNFIFYQDKEIDTLNKKIFIDNKYVNITNFNDYNNNDVLIINYLLDELEKLFSINQSDKFIKIQSGLLVIEIIQHIYDNYIDLSKDISVKKFKYSIEMFTEYEPFDESGVGFYGELERELTDEELVSQNENMLNDKASLESIDISQELAPEDIEYPNLEGHLPLDIFEFLK